MKLFFILALFGALIMFSLYMDQCIEELQEEIRTLETAIEFLEKRIDQAKRPLLKGLKK